MTAFAPLNKRGNALQRSQQKKMRGARTAPPGQRKQSKIPPTPSQVRKRAWRISPRRNPNIQKGRGGETQQPEDEATIPPTLREEEVETVHRTDPVGEDEGTPKEEGGRQAGRRGNCS
jgi:hypothetical protein